MVDTAIGLPTLLLFSIALIALAWFSSQISDLTQLITLRLTGSIDAAMVAYFVLVLPGIAVHEGAHWIVARVLGLRPGNFTVWPKRYGAMIRLGSVTVRQGGPLLDSLVGMAPLFAGVVLVGLCARQLFQGDPLAPLLTNASLGAWLTALGAAFLRPASLLWSYLIFTVANGMMPSESDRRPLRPVLIFIGVAIVVYLIIGLPVAVFSSALNALTPALLWVSSGLVIAVFIDLAVILLLVGLIALTRGR
jgi:hypothetical protein